MLIMETLLPLSHQLQELQHLQEEQQHLLIQL